MAVPTERKVLEREIEDLYAWLEKNLTQVELERMNDYVEACTKYEVEYANR